MAYFVICPQCNEENTGSLLNCAKCGTSLIGIPRQSRITPQEMAANSQANTASFRYESARVAHLMDEYSKITNIKECRDWEEKARTVASYMSEAVAKTEQFIAVEGRRLEQASDKTEKTHVEMGLMQFESFRRVVGGQLERLNKTIDNLPKGENDNESVNLPPENVTLKKRNTAASVNIQILRVVALVIIALLLWYFFSGK